MHYDSHNVRMISRSRGKCARSEVWQIVSDFARVRPSDG